MHYPADYAIEGARRHGRRLRVTVKALKRRVRARAGRRVREGLGEFETLEALRDTCRGGSPSHEAEEEADRDCARDLLKQLAGRVTFDVPDSLIEREIERRLEEFARRLMEQGVDPSQAGHRLGCSSGRRQRDAAREAVAGALVLDEVARREGLTVTDAGIVEREIGEVRRRTGRTAGCRPCTAREGWRHLTAVHRVTAGEGG